MKNKRVNHKAFCDKVIKSWKAYNYIKREKERTLSGVSTWRSAITGPGKKPENLFHRSDAGEFLDAGAGVLVHT